MSNISSTSSSITATPSNVRVGDPPQPTGVPADKSSRIPVTPAALRSIFASSRTIPEERSLSRVAFFRFAGFVLSCVAISLAAARGRGIKSSAALLGVGVV